MSFSLKLVAKLATKFSKVNEKSQKIIISLNQLLVLPPNENILQEVKTTRILHPSICISDYSDNGPVL